MDDQKGVDDADAETTPRVLSVSDAPLGSKFYADAET